MVKGPGGTWGAWPGRRAPGEGRGAVSRAPLHPGVPAEAATQGHTSLDLLALIVVTHVGRGGTVKSGEEGQNQGMAAERWREREMEMQIPREGSQRQEDVDVSETKTETHGEARTE